MCAEHKVFGAFVPVLSVVFRVTNNDGRNTENVIVGSVPSHVIHSTPCIRSVPSHVIHSTLCDGSVPSRVWHSIHCIRSVPSHVLRTHRIRSVASHILRSTLYIRSVPLHFYAAHPVLEVWLPTFYAAHLY